MFHTPNLTGLRKRLIPKRINEGWGLQHMKLYGFDDEVIISGCELLNRFWTLEEHNTKTVLEPTSPMTTSLIARIAIMSSRRNE